MKQYVVFFLCVCDFLTGLCKLFLSTFTDIRSPKEIGVHLSHCFLRLYCDCAMGWFDHL